MKLRSLLFVCCLGLFTSAFAENHHFHPQANNPNAKGTDAKVAVKAIQYPGYCQIEVVNNYSDHVVVYGVFDDGTPLKPFNIYMYEIPHYVDLYYYGACHAGMKIYIDSFGGYSLFARYVPVGSTVFSAP